MNKILSLMLCCWLLPAVAADVYMSRDANGNVIFSDTPSPNATVHEVKALPSVPALAPSATTAPQTPAKATETAFSYTSLSIVSPTNQLTLPTGSTGDLDISGILSPSLRETDTVHLLDNGKAIQQGRQTSFQLTNLDRGEHKFQIVVRDKQGKTLISSNSVTVYVQRAMNGNRHKPTPAK